MSTILDALRKAQEETGGAKDVRLEKVPGVDSNPTVVPRSRRRHRPLFWLLTVLGVLAVAFAGGLALGNRVSDLFGSSSEKAVATSDSPVAAQRQASAPDTVAPKEHAARAQQPVVAEPKRPTESEASAERLASARREAQAPVAPAAAEPEDAAPGERHTFGALPGASGANESDSDRAARLQQLRDRLLKARRDASERSSGRADKAPIPIIVPPPRAPDAQRQAVPSQKPAVATARTSDAAAPPSQPEVAVAPVTNPAVAETAAVANPTVADAPPAEAAVVAAEPAAPAPRPADVSPPAGAVGVSVAAAHDDATHAEVPDEEVATAEGEPPPPTDGTNAAVQVAALPAPAPAAPAPPPVLRHSPGGAPQVAINILQWSAEPGRRFAFVSIDGGGITQVHEGDRVAGLTVKRIHQQMIEFGYNDSSFLLRAY